MASHAERDEVATMVDDDKGRAARRIMAAIFILAFVPWTTPGAAAPVVLETGAENFAVGRLVIDQDAIHFVSGMLPIYPCPELSIAEDVVFAGPLETEVLAPLDGRADMLVRVDVQVKRGNQVIFSTGDVKRIQWEGLTPVSWNQEILFNHTTTPYSITTYSVVIEAASWPGPEPVTLRHEVSFEVAPCLPPAGLTEIAVDVPPPPKPPLVVPTMEPTVTPEIMENQSRIIRSDDILAAPAVSLSQTSSLGSSSTMAAPGGFAVHDKYMSHIKPASGCSPPPRRTGLDAKDDYMEGFLHIKTAYATRVDMYYVHTDTNQIKYWWYVNIPSAGSWWVCMHQPLEGSDASTLRGRWHTHVRGGGGGGWMDGWTWQDASVAFTIQPYIYATSYVPTDKCEHPFPGAKTNYHKTDHAAMRLTWWDTDEMTQTHDVWLEYFRPDRSSIGRHVGQFDPNRGWDAWGWCHWVYIDNYARTWPGTWTERASSGSGAYSREQSFTIVNRAPATPTPAGPAHNYVTENPVVTFSWSGGNDPDNDPVRYEVRRNNVWGPVICSAWSGDECKATIAAPDEFDWVVVAIDRTDASYRTASAARHITLIDPPPDEDGDGVPDADDVDPTHNVQVEFDLIEVMSSQDRDFRYSVEFYEPAPNKWWWVLPYGPRLHAEEHAIFRTDPNVRSYRDAGTYDFTWDVPDHQKVVWVEINLWDDQGTGGDCLDNKSDDTICERLDINDYDITDSEYDGQYNGAAFNESDFYFGCQFELDLRTGHWGPIPFRHWQRPPSDRAWDPHEEAEGQNNGFGSCAQSPSHTAPSNGGPGELPKRPWGHHLVRFDLTLTDGDGDGMPWQWEIDHGIETVSSKANPVPSTDARNGNPDNDAYTNYEEWFLRHNVVSAAAPGVSNERGKKIAVQYFVEAGITAEEEAALAEHFRQASLYLWDATDGHVWVHRWSETATRASADVLIRDGCDNSFVPGNTWPQAHFGGISGAGTITMSPGWQGDCDKILDPSGYQNEWSKTMAHEMGHYILNARDEYFNNNGWDAAAGAEQCEQRDGAGACVRWQSFCYVTEDHGTSDKLTNSLMDRQHSDDLHELDAQIDATHRFGGNGPACDHSFHWTDRGRSAWEEFAIWSNTRAPFSTNPAILWNFDHDNTNDAPHQINALFTQHYSGPMDPIDRITEVT